MKIIDKIKEIVLRDDVYCHSYKKDNGNTHYSFGRYTSRKSVQKAMTELRELLADYYDFKDNATFEYSATLKHLGKTISMQLEDKEYSVTQVAQILNSLLYSLDHYIAGLEKCHTKEKD